MDESQSGAVGKQPTLRISPHVQLDLTHSLALELLIERWMCVLPRIRDIAEIGEVELQQLRAGLDVLAVVCADRLNLIETQDVVLWICRCRRALSVTSATSQQSRDNDNSESSDPRLPE